MKATTEKYYLYHIPGKKWGCTNNLEKRLKRQNYKIEDLANLIIVGNLDKAADMEAELNKEYGYGGNQLRDYRSIIKSAELGKKIIGNKSINGKLQGKLNVLSGHLAKVRNPSKAGYISAMKETAPNKQIVICPNCGKIGQYPAMTRWHLNNCKFA